MDCKKPYLHDFPDLKVKLYGVEAATEIRKNLEWDDIPILAIAANAMESDKKRCLLASMQGQFAKPLVKDELLNSIIAQLNK